MKSCCFTGHRNVSEWDIGAMRVERDRYMADHSERVKAVCRFENGELPNGGTKRTVDSAKAKGREVVLVPLFDTGTKHG